MRASSAWPNSLHRLCNRSDGKLLTVRCNMQDAPQENGKLTRNTAQNIVNARWTMPADVQVSQNCLELLTAIFNTNPQVRPGLKTAGDADAQHLLPVECMHVGM